MDILLIVGGYIAGIATYVGLMMWRSGREWREFKRMNQEREDTVYMQACKEIHRAMGERAQGHTPTPFDKVSIKI